MKEYRESVEKTLKEAADIQADAAAKSAMVEKAVSNAEIDVPAPMVEEKLDEMMQQMNWRMQQQGFTMEQYMKSWARAKRRCGYVPRRG